MGLKKIPHMNGGDGESSYANNSGLQKFGISKTWAVLDETLKDMFDDGLPKCFKVVDLGCSSGPNTLLVISHIMDTFQEYLCCKNKDVNFNYSPEFQFFLNDLPSNDFNNIFELLPSFYKERGIERDSQFFICGMPGSFYERLFPSQTLHFAYSSYSLHWLSQVPEGLEKNNKENIYLAMTSPPDVFRAYAKQYEKDFTKFLKLRSEEIISGGRMVLAFLGRSVEDPSCKDDFGVCTFLAKTLLDMVSEGIFKEDDLYSFNLPTYGPCQQEVEEIIKNEGSFKLEKMEVFQVPWDANGETNDPAFDPNCSGKLVAGTVRAVLEPMLSRHFGSSINYGALFERYAKKVADHLSKEKSSHFNIAISLSRRSN